MDPDSLGCTTSCHGGLTNPSFSRATIAPIHAHPHTGCFSGPSDAGCQGRYENFAEKDGI